MAESDMGGYKLASATVTGRGAYGLLKFESGIHRVQRVPVTESSGRLHTSAASVAVMPQAEEVRPRRPIPMACYKNLHFLCNLQSSICSCVLAFSHA